MNLALKLAGIRWESTHRHPRTAEDIRLPLSCRALCVSLAQPVLQLLDSMHSAFRRGGDTVQEMCLQTQRDGWVVGRKSGERELFVLLQPSIATIAEVQTVLAKLRQDTFFNTIFLM